MFLIVLLVTMKNNRFTFHDKTRATVSHSFWDSPTTCSTLVPVMNQLLKENDTTPQWVEPQTPINISTSRYQMYNQMYIVVMLSLKISFTIQFQTLSLKAEDLLRWVLPCLGSKCESAACRDAVFMLSSLYRLSLLGM